MYKCAMCGGSGIAEFFDMANPLIPNGNYTMNELIEKYGEKTKCPDCNGSGKTLTDNRTFQPKLETSLCNN